MLEPSSCRATHAEIDLAACVRNLRCLQGRVEGADVWPVVKADAYGHGATEVTRALEGHRVAGFCVATVTEGRTLRQAGIGHPILVMAGIGTGGEVDPARVAIEYGLAVAVQDAATAALLAEVARDAGIGPASVHLKLDTGMGRLGVDGEKALDLAGALASEPALSFDGMFSNLASADCRAFDDPGTVHVRRQADEFDRVCALLDRAGVLPPHRTLANSAAVMHHPETWRSRTFTGVRPGLAIYGASLTPGHDPVELTPAMRLLSRVQSVRRLPAGAVVGYGAETKTRRPSTLAALPIGYHDGLPRAISSPAHVLVGGRRAPLIGRLSMDLALADVTDLSSVAPGDPVVIFGHRADEPDLDGDDGDRAEGYGDTLAAAVEGADGAAVAARPRPGRAAAPTVEDLAVWAGTIPHEILCTIGARVPRRYRETDGRSRGSS